MRKRTAIVCFATVALLVPAVAQTQYQPPDSTRALPRERPCVFQAETGVLADDGHTCVLSAYHNGGHGVGHGGGNGR